MAYQGSGSPAGYGDGHRLQDIPAGSVSVSASRPPFIAVIVDGYCLVMNLADGELGNVAAIQPGRT
jgi:hypothetical protein